MVGSASDEMKENHLDEVCDLAPWAMLNACVAVDPKCKVLRDARVKVGATLVAGEIAVAHSMDSLNDGLKSVDKVA